MYHYNKGDGLQNPFLDEDIEPLALTEGDIDDLVAFVASLTSPDYRDQGAAELARQRELARTSRPQRDTARAFAPILLRPRPRERLQVQGSRPSPSETIGEAQSSSVEMFTSVAHAAGK
jgi:hypothetical protein